MEVEAHVGEIGDSIKPSRSFESRLCFSLVADILKQVEIELLEVKAIRFLADYPWVPGKRLRPIIFLLSNLCFRLEKGKPIQNNNRESLLAAAIELLHEASLIHDDLVDRSELRRGAPTMQMTNSEGFALLIGDYMIFRGFKLILDAANSREDILLAQELANTGLSIAHGEVDQLDHFLNNRDQDRVSMEIYLNVIAKKTAAFFAGCAEAGVALAGAGPSLRKIFRNFGMSMGMLFQMVDDMMDIFGDPAMARKTLRNNLAEGTVTLPMVQAWLADGDDPDLSKLVERKQLSVEEQNRLYTKLASVEIRQRCQAVMDQYADEAQQWLEEMPVNIYRLGLYDLLDYIRKCPWGGLVPVNCESIIKEI